MRKAPAKRRVLPADPRYKDPLVTRFVNNIMERGKKSVAYSICYQAFALVEKNTKENGYEIWKKALQNVMPSVEVKTRRIGGANFQIPIEVPPDRKIALGMKWLLRYARERKGKSMADKLAAEIIAASRNEGGAVKKREDTHKMAEANKAFSHFRLK
ncbi:MAG: 30S ribosomal protein S7 [Chitinophagales bacterium]|nr:MAG: 30S ribosomal protein S7 [Chitinophagales bacterium]